MGKMDVENGYIGMNPSQNQMEEEFYFVDEPNYNINQQSKYYNIPYNNQRLRYSQNNGFVQSGKILVIFRQTKHYELFMQQLGF